MNHSIPVLIANQNEDIRQLLKEMLIKHGFFHLIEAQTSVETQELISDEQFILIESGLINEKLKKILISKKNFLVFANGNDLVALSVLYGIDHLISFPYSSKNLIHRMYKLINQ